MKSQSPIIITGMHRSGTSLLSRIIEYNSVFFGSYKDINNESIYFQNINKWLMSINSSSWDNPSSFLDSINTDNFKINTKKLGLIINGKSNFKYFGLKNIIINKNFFTYNNLWGWKDPRNIFTLPFWFELFPNSKVIIVSRHPFDVVNSLLKREKNNIKNDKNNISKYYPYFLITFFRLSNFSNRSSLLIKNFDDGINLYIKYFDESKRLLDKYKKNIKIVRYEDLITNKVESINEVLQFLNIKSINKNNKFLETINEDRAFNFRLDNNFDNSKFKKYQTILEKCGYNVN